ncbi:MAG: Gfo/Idh/MocA family oxidoreductase [Spirochaetales bacterium]|nr:Gfo/Idh/MocA family oxidoreductase [Spirochaetales bacterium]
MEIGAGIIGAGVRGVYCLGQAIVTLYKETGIVVQGVYDIVEKRSYESKEYLEKLYSDMGVNRSVKVYGSYNEMIDSEECRIIIITNHTNNHREPAVMALRKGKKVYLDKPISVTLDDAEAIVEAEKANPLIMGFTRRYEAPWIKAKELLDSGVIGKLQMMEINSLIPYQRYLQTWHRKRELSGGSINDKNSHHFDVFNWMAGEYPSFLTAVGGRSSVFPVEENAPKSCRVCKRDCHYRRDDQKISDGAYVLQLDSWKNTDEEIEMIDTCVYAPGSDISDHALVSVVYPSGVKASLFFSIFGPDTKDQETLTLLGEKGKIFLNRHEGTVTLYSRWGEKEEIFDCKGDNFGSSHFGADEDLIRVLKKFLDGDNPTVKAIDGMKSLEMVLAAQESIDKNGLPVRFS